MSYDVLVDRVFFMAQHTKGYLLPILIGMVFRLLSALLFHPLVEILCVLCFFSQQIVLWKCILGLFFLSPLYLNTSLVLLHRFFAHRAFHCKRGVQFALAWVSCIGNQGGPIWWASKHRRHHKHCDTVHDPHSPRHGIFYAWLGWLFCESHVDTMYVQDLLKYPELKWLDRFHFVPLLLHLYLFPTIEDSVAFGMIPLIACTLYPLYFNVGFHQNKQKDRCRASDVLFPRTFFHDCRHLWHPGHLLHIFTGYFFVVFLTGENMHKRHHEKPRQIKRHKYDMGYWCVIYPLLSLGLVTQKQIQ